MHKRRFLAAALVTGVTLVVFLPALGNGFVTWDDALYVYQNPNIRAFDLDFLGWACTAFHATNWHPLTWVSHAADYHFWHLNPFGHHLTSLLLHGMNTFLVVLLVVALMRAARARRSLAVACLTGLLFGIHPLHVESVAWVSERKDVLSTFFYLAALLAYCRYASRVTSARRDASVPPRLVASYWLSLLLFALGLLAKPMVVTLPVILLLLDGYPFGRLTSAGRRRAVLDKVPFFLLALASAALTLIAQKSGGAVTTVDTLPIATRLVTATVGLGFYVYKLLLPLQLCAFYPYPQDDPWSALLSVQSLVSLTLVVAIVVLSVGPLRRVRGWLVAWIAYVVMVAPVLGIIQVGQQAFADRYAYLPSLGPLLLVSVAAAGLFGRDFPRGQRRVVALAGTALLCGALAWGTVVQIGVWRNGETLWTRVLELYPGTFTAHNNRGVFHSEQGRHDLAVLDFTRALGVARTFAVEPHSAFVNRALSRAELRQFTEALADADLAVRLKPADWETRCVQGRVLSLAGRHRKALAAFGAAAALRPAMPDTYRLRAVVFMRLGDYRSALGDLETAEARGLAGDFAFYNDRAIVLARLERYQEALADYDRAIALDARSPRPFFNRGNLQVKLGRLEEAIRDYTEAIARSPRPVFDHYNNRGIIYKRLGRLREAEADFTRARSLQRRP